MAATTPEVVLDCSFLAHALVPSQRTVDAAAALDALLRSERGIIVHPALILEFSSLILRLRRRGLVTESEAIELFAFLDHLSEPAAVVVGMTPTERVWRIAFALGQTDTFDASGYVTARMFEAEFWTCDRRFANAAAVQGLVGVVAFP